VLLINSITPFAFVITLLAPALLFLTGAAGQRLCSMGPVRGKLTTISSRQEAQNSSAEQSHVED
jgi:hypothetical protein